MQLFDAHLHIINKAFSIKANAGFIPEAFTVEQYLHQMKGYDLTGGAIVSGSFQGFDQNYLIAALKLLGPTFVGVTQLPASVSDEEILALNKVGVRALRFNLRRGGSATLSELDRLAQRVYEVAGWHSELYVDSSELALQQALSQPLASILVNLPAVSIDHLGLSKAGLPSLLKLVEQGVRVKATGFGRVNFDIPTALRNLHSANPSALMFGSDLPSTRAPRPFFHNDISLIIDCLGEEQASAVLHANAADFYHA